MSLSLHHADDAERLAETLWTVLDREPERGRPIAGPGSAEIIVVQSKGMARWLQLGLAEAVGICANVDFPFPRPFLEGALDAILGPDTRVWAFEKDRMLWALADLLPQRLDAPAFAPLRRYAGVEAGNSASEPSGPSLDEARYGGMSNAPDEQAGLRRMQLAARVAAVFDDYLVYRPDLLVDWERGGAGPFAGAKAVDVAPTPGFARTGPDSLAHAAWQADLWRGLVERCCAGSGRHFAARIARLVERGPREGDAELLPARVSVFGVSAMPLAFLQALAALSRSIELHLFVLGPSPAVWSRARGQADRLRELVEAGAEPDALAERLARPDGCGHPLLASCGRMAREFEASVLAAALGAGGLEAPGADGDGDPAACEDVGEGSADHFVDGNGPGERETSPRPPGSLLAVLQADLRADRRRGRGPGHLPPLDPDPADRSVSIHSCHGPMREVEVLRDHLLALFEAPGLALKPREVIVMVPEIERYAPYVEAVFGRLPDESGAIPYGIADREPGATHRLFSALERVLEVLRGRMSAPDLLSLLAMEPVAARFGIHETDLSDLRHWVDAAGIRWGVDAEHRRASGQPALDENTWRRGLERLLLGYSLPDAVEAPFEGRLPVGAPEGADAELVGRLARAGETLFALQSLVKGRRAVPAWRAALQAVIEATLDDGWRSAAERRQLLRALATVERHALEAGFTEPVDLDLVLGQMTRGLREEAPPSGFLAGGVTFCALAPMRAIPFRVVCLLGMSEGAFPRGARRAGFDLLEAAPRIGDREARDDDRHLFLEAVMAARERLWISYEGQSASDGRSLPPSVVVVEMLDLLGEAVDFPVPATESAGPDQGRTAAAWRALVTAHPGQPFSRRYREAEPGLFTYAERFGGVRAGAAPPELRPFFSPSELLPSAAGREDERYAQHEKPRRGRGSGSAEAEGDPRRATEVDALEEKAEVRLSDLLRFFAHPARHLLQQGLGLVLEVGEGEPEDREPMGLDGLSSWALGSRWLRDRVSGIDEGLAEEHARQSGLLPLGTVGRIALEELEPRVRAMEEAARAVRGSTETPRLHEIDLDLGVARLTGRIRDLYPRAALRIRFGQLRAQDRLDLWIRHLALQLAGEAGGAEAGLPERSLLVAEAAKGRGALTLALDPLPAEKARETMRQLVDLHRAGTERPLPFLPEPSWAYADTLRGKGDRSAALRAAARGWRPTYGRGPDAYLQQAFGALDLAEAMTEVAAGRMERITERRPERDGGAGSPVDVGTLIRLLEDFETLARVVFDPLLDAEETVA